MATPVSYSGGGSVNLSSPPPIGDDTPNTIDATALRVNGGAGTPPALPAGYQFSVSSAGAVGVILGRNSAGGMVLLSTVYGNATVGTDSVNGNLILSPTANIVVQRNGAYAQTLQLYGTYTNDANYERARLGIQGDHFTIQTEHAGTGVARKIQLITLGSAATEFYTNSTHRWSIEGPAGHLLAATDATYNIGDPSDKRPNNVYVASTVRIGGGLLYLSNAILYNNGAGVVRLCDAADTGIAKLNFGKDDNTAPALKRSGTTLEGRLADDSGYCSTRYHRYTGAELDVTPIFCYTNQARFNADAEVGFSSGAASSTGIDTFFTRAAAGVMTPNGPFRFKSYTVGTLPDPAIAGFSAVIGVTDDVGGATLAYSQGGSDWLRVRDNAVISYV